MYRIRIHGRGGQGIKMASHVLGTALFRTGYRVQDAPKYGAERRGAPIFATVRADSASTGPEVIAERGVINNPDLVIVADDTLLAVPAAGTLQGVGEQSVLLVNSRDNAQTWRERLNLESRIVVLPEAGPEEDRAQMPYVGATCVGAAARLLGVISADTLAAAIAEELGELGADVVSRNCDRALRAFDSMAEYEGLVAEGTLIAADDYRAPAWVELPLEGVARAAPAIHTTANSVQVRTGLWRTMRPVVDYDHCNGCWWVCSTLCPDSAIAVENKLPVIDYDHCKGCLVCVGVCPTHAIEALPEYLAQLEEAESTGGGKES
jgi:pyruvate ferredoxin oxidoreductase gamma subunit